MKGVVVDELSGKGVPFANMRNLENGKKYVTDSLGRFLICEINKQSIVLEISHTSFNKRTIEITAEQLASSELIKVSFLPKSVSISGVTILSRRDQSFNSAFTGNQTITQKDLLKLPTIMGESDVIRSIQLLPGVQTVGEGIGGVFVRGGGAGQNLFVLDDMELLNPTHLMGIYSVFNSLTTSSVEVYKGNAPVELQEHLSSTVVVESKEPVKKGFGITANIGNISSSIALTGMSNDGKLSFIVGVRRSYLEAVGSLASLIIPDDENYFKKYNYNFQDINGALKWHITPSSLFSVSGYLGGDYFNLNNTKANFTNAGSNWGNRSFACSYQYSPSQNNTFKHSISYSSVYSNFNGNILDNSIKFNSFLSQIKQKNSWSFRNDNHFINTGLEFLYSETIPQDMNFFYNTDTVSRREFFRNLGLSLFAGDKIQLKENMILYAGLRFNANSSKYQANKNSIPFYSFSPAIAFSMFLEKERSVKIAYSRNTQQVHLCSFSSLPIPNDIWMCSTAVLKPEISNQITLGYYQKKNAWNWTAEIYGKSLQNQLIFNLNVDNTSVDKFENDFFMGKGYAYGLDISIGKNIGRLTGSLNYSLAHSIRSFPGILEGKWFNDKYDRTHDLKLFLGYELTKKWNLSLVWVYATGNNATLPVGRWWMINNIMNDYDGINNVRLPAYHRLDVAANYTLTSNHLKESVLCFSIINLYNRANPYYLVYKVYSDSNQYNIQVKAVQTSLFPVMPSVSWRFTL
ncbi:MAG: TonB-dependent receptor [Bacteroidota bacterium]|nr:TonB-dependent receptor [Bacteroidota bacterium]